MNYSTNISASSKLAESIQTGLPLESGLRALSSEIESYSLRRKVRRLASELEKGKPLLQITQDLKFPQYFSALLAAGMKSGNPVAAILEYQNYLTAQRLHQNMIIAQLLRICFSLLLTLIIFSVTFLVIIPTYNHQVLQLFDMDVFSGRFGPFFYVLFTLADWLVLLHQSSTYNIPGGIFTLIGIAIGILISTVLMLGPYTILGFIPWIGNIIRDYQLSRVARLMSLQLAYDQPLPDAISLTKQQVGDYFIRHQLSDIQKSSHYESDFQLEESNFPEGFSRTFLMSGTGRSLSDRFAQWAEIFSTQSRNSLRWLIGVAEPLIYFFTLFFFITVVFVFLFPLIKMLNELS